VDRAPKAIAGMRVVMAGVGRPLARSGADEDQPKMSLKLVGEFFQFACALSIKAEDAQHKGQVARMSAATCGFKHSEASPGRRFTHPAMFVSSKFLLQMVSSILGVLRMDRYIFVSQILKPELLARAHSLVRDATENCMMNSYLSYGIPIFTFLLGSALTLVLKQYDRRNFSLAVYARDLSDSANEWYTQLYEIRNMDSSDQDFEKKAALYERNRLVLPKFIRALEALKKYSKAKQLVTEGERFLSVVTVAKEAKKATSYTCRSCAKVFTPPLLFLGNQLPSSSHGLFLTDDFVEDLDRHIQSINAEAGKIL
jgi:hypothetical protein